MIYLCSLSFAGLNEVIWASSSPVFLGSGYINNIIVNFIGSNGMNRGNASEFSS